MTFDVRAELLIGIQYDWQHWYELFSECRQCHGSTVFVVSQTAYDYGPKEKRSPAQIPDALTDAYAVERYVSLASMATVAPPDYCDKAVAAVFREAATCFKVECFNAAGAMFRLAVDLATRPMLPAAGTAGAPNAWTRDKLRPRLDWLFANGKLPQGLHELAGCITDDGNDGAHAGTLTKAEAEDLLDFTTALLERVYTEPEKLRLAKQRTQQRRGGNQNQP